MSARNIPGPTASSSSRNNLGALALIFLLAACGQQTDHAARDWPQTNGDIANTRYSTLSQITPANVKTLGGAWFHKFEGPGSRATPVVVDGRMFVTQGANLLAFSAATGEQLWTRKLSNPPMGAYKGVGTGEGLVFVGGVNSFVAAVRQDTGEVAWETSIAPDTKQGAGAITSGPTYAAGLVITGSAGGDVGNRGRLAALDAKTGKVVWRFHTVPDAGEPGSETWGGKREEWQPGGGAVWMNPAVDLDLGLVYVGVGNPTPQFGGEARPGANLYTDSALALDLKTGALKWHYQVVHHDIWEADLGTPFILYDAPIAGKPQKAVGVMSTYGYLFLLDRATGTPLLPVEERKVPQNERLGTWATQPFPVEAERIGTACVRPETIPNGFKPLCEFDPIDVDMPNVMYPEMTMRAAPMAYSPDTGLFYAAGADDWPSWTIRGEDPKFFLALPTLPGMKYSGILAGVDARTSKISWQKKVPYTTQHNMSGFTATKGGVVFHGEGDGHLQAYDAKSGELLWQFQTGAPANGAVSTYDVGGTQYVAVAVSDGVWAFKLGGTMAPRSAPPAPKGEADFSGRIVPTNQVAMAGEMEDTGLNGHVRRMFNEFAFMPMRAKVSVGEKVTWTNAGKEAHAVTAEDSSWTTGPVAPGKSVTLTFSKPGTFTYRCTDHPWSLGQLIVEE